MPSSELVGYNPHFFKTPSQKMDLIALAALRQKTQVENRVYLLIKNCLAVNVALLAYTLFNLIQEEARHLYALSEGHGKKTSKRCGQLIHAYLSKNNLSSLKEYCAEIHAYFNTKKDKTCGELLAPVCADEASWQGTFLLSSFLLLLTAFIFIKRKHFQIPLSQTLATEFDELALSHGFLSINQQAPETFNKALDTIFALELSVLMNHTAEFGMVKEMATFYEQGARLNTICPHTGHSPLHKALLGRKINTLEFILEKAPGLVTVGDYKGNTALHYATSLPFKDTPTQLTFIQALLRTGSDPHQANHAQETPFQNLERLQKNTPKKRDFSSFLHLKKLLLSLAQEEPITPQRFSLGRE